MKPRPKETKRHRIRAYNKRLAGIHLSEESIDGLPMNVEGFHGMKVKLLFFC